ncbi:MAG: AmmeMemoRadiSam system protein B [Spirochaetota bacterium]
MYIRKPAVAGQFYQADSIKLAKEIDLHLKNADVSLDADLIAVISPHAGYVFSGPVAGVAYAAARNRTFDSVIVFAPSHRYRIPGASVIETGKYRTPLRDTEIDSTLAASLIDGELFIFSPDIHETEHSLEVQVPFIQTIYPDLPLVPIVVGTTSYDICLKMGKRVADTVIEHSRKPLIVISTDMSHYLSYEQAIETDKKLCDALETADTLEIKKVIESGTSSACGYGSIIAGMTAAQMLGANECRILDYRNSGDTAGPKTQVVGYCAAAITKEQ